MTEMRGLDNWITGHYGADAPSERRDDSLEDEGLLTLQDAMDYLADRAKADEDDQVTGEYEAYAILDCAYTDIRNDYQCHFCGFPISKRSDKYCSRNCYVADHEGL